jgi:hypothetical protein
MFDPSTKGAALDKNGDWTINAKSRRLADSQTVVERSSLTLPRSFNAKGESVRELKNFIAWAKSKNVKLIASWPIFYAYNRNGLDQLAKRINELFSEVDVPMVGKPEDFFYPIDNFFDSANHPTAEGAEIYTRQLAHELRPLVTISTQPLEKSR